MTHYVLTSAAEDDLRNILEFLVVESPSTATRVLDALQEAMRLLGERPGIGHRRTDLADETLRFWPVFSYLVIYRPDTAPVQVIRILHGARDVRRLLEG
jgi:antitoxin ParD1/3/4/toxin ParE1/3/4